MRKTADLRELLPERLDRLAVEVEPRGVNRRIRLAFSVVRPDREEACSIRRDRRRELVERRWMLLDRLRERRLRAEADLGGSQSLSDRQCDHQSDMSKGHEVIVLDSGI
jgi:hypothetical protein